MYCNTRSFSDMLPCPREQRRAFARSSERRSACPAASGVDKIGRTQSFHLPAVRASHPISSWWSSCPLPSTRHLWLDAQICSGLQGSWSSVDGGMAVPELVALDVELQARRQAETPLWQSCSHQPQHGAARWRGTHGRLSRVSSTRCTCSAQRPGRGCG